MKKLLLILLFISSPAMAETGAIPGTAPLPAGPQATPTIGGTVQDPTIKPAVPLSISDSDAGTIFGQYSSVQTIFGAANSNADAVKGLLTGTFWGLALISFVWVGLKMALGQKHGMTELIETVLEVGMFFFLFDQYQMITGAIVDSMQALAGVVSGGDATAANGSKIFLNAAMAQFNAISSIMDAGGTSALAKLGAFLENIVQELILTLAACMMLFASIIYVMMYFVGDAMAAVAVSLGPLFIALGVSPWLRDFFSGWVKTLMTSLGYKVAAATIVGLMSHAITNAAAHMSNQGYMQSLITSISALTFSFLCIYIMFKVPELASSLFGAGIRAGSELGGEAGSAAKAGGKAAGKAAAKKVAKVAASAATGGASNIVP